jgi:hypothetical protein
MERGRGYNCGYKQLCQCGHLAAAITDSCEKNWSRHSDLNRGPAVYETAALPLSYVGPDAHGSPWSQRAPGALRHVDSAA